MLQIIGFVKNGEFIVLDPLESKGKQIDYLVTTGQQVPKEKYVNMGEYDGQVLVISTPGGEPDYSPGCKLYNAEVLKDTNKVNKILGDYIIRTSGL